MLELGLGLGFGSGVEIRLLTLYRVRAPNPNPYPRDSQEAPNLQLMYWPELDVSRGILPRRAFLVAKHAVPAYP